jgi:hypothetical protein
MLQVVFQGLAGFACQSTGWDVFLPRCSMHPHTAVLTALAGAVVPDPTKTTWQPDCADLDGDGHIRCSWVLRGMRLALTEQQGGTTACTRSGQPLARLDVLYKGSKVHASERFLSGGTRLHLPGGTLTGVGGDLFEVEDATGKTVQPAPLAPMALWTGAGSGPWTLSTVDGANTITLTDAGPAGPIVWLSFTNAVPEFSTTIPFDHFLGIYEALEETGSATEPPPSFVIAPSKLSVTVTNFSEGIPCFALAELPT